MRQAQNQIHQEQIRILGKCGLSALRMVFFNLSSETSKSLLFFNVCVTDKNTDASNNTSPFGA
jgi:hypothetical protein